jgi:hypothetical protein
MPRKPNKEPKAKKSRKETTIVRALNRSLVVTKEPEDDKPIKRDQNFIFPDEVKRAGAKGLYTPEILPRLEQLCLQGLNNKEIAKAMGIGERTFYEWIDAHAQFSHSLKKYRGLADIEVENALYKSALGFKITETEREARKIEGQYKLVTTKETDKYIPGNSIAQIFYLKNRMPDRYKDKIETQISLANDISQLAFAIKRREE